MRLASETRAAAWQSLRENDAYGKYLIGVALLSLVVLALALVGGLLGLGGAWLLKPYFAKSTLVFDPVAMNKNPMFWWQLAGDFFHQPAEVIGASLGLGCLLAVVIFWGVGFYTWSSRAMAIASARKGVTAMHAFSGWGHGWKMLGLQLWRDTVVALGLCLLIVPGVRWAFSYEMASYLQVDHPEWTSWQCLRESERLMEGNRWRLFVLGFSFLGWYAAAYLCQRLVPFVGGFANFFLTPYPETALALFYEELLDHAENPQGESVVPNNEPERNPGNDEH